MTTAVKYQAIDADAHVIESEQTWDHLDEADRQYRPFLFTNPERPASRYWVIDGRIAGTPPRVAGRARIEGDVRARRARPRHG